MKISKILSYVMLGAARVRGTECPAACDCYEGNKIVICAYKGLEMFPDISQSPDIEEFVLVNNQIPSLARLANQESGFSGAQFKMPKGILQHYPYDLDINPLISCLD